MYSTTLSNCHRFFKILSRVRDAGRRLAIEGVSSQHYRAARDHYSAVRGEEHITCERRL